VRFSIVFDDNGTVLATSATSEEAQKPTPGPGISTGYLDISDERLLIDMDPSKLKRGARRKGGRWYKP
jgi:hypothetical protein